MPKFDITKLQEERNDEAESASVLIATAKDDSDRDLTAEEVSQFGVYMDRVDELDAEITTIQNAAEASMARAERLRKASALQRAAMLEPRLGAPSLLEGSHGGLESKPKIIGGPDATQFGHFGEYLFAVKDFYISGGSAADPRLGVLGDTGNEQAAQANPAGQNTVIPSEGGFLIQKDQSTDLIQKAFSEGDILSRVNKKPLGPNSDGVKIPYLKENSRVAGSRYGGVQTFWVEQGGAITASQADFGQLEWSLHKVASVGYVTNEMLKDSTFTGAFMMDLFSRAITFAVEESIISGTGTGQPLGIRIAPCKITVPKESGQAALSIVGDNALQMWSRLALSSRRNAIWLTSQDSEPQLWKMSAYSIAVEGANTATQGLPMVLPSGVGMNQSNLPSLLGRPIVTTEHAQTVGTEGDFMLWDPSEYLLVDKEGIETAASIHVRFLTDEQTFRVTYRVDGQPLWPSAVTPVHGTNTISPIITLAVRG